MDSYISDLHQKNINTCRRFVVFGIVLLVATIAALAVLVAGYHYG